MGGLHHPSDKRPRFRAEKKPIAEVILKVAEVIVKSQA